MAFQYITASGLTGRMTLAQINELLTEDDLIEDSDVTAALSYADSGDSNGLNATQVAIGDYVSDYIAFSEGIVNSYLSRRYAVPVQASDGSVPNEIKDACYVVLRYKLMYRRTMVPQEIVDEYESTMMWLRDIASGRASLAILTSDTTQEDRTSTGRTGTTTRTGLTFNSLAL